MGCGMGVVKYLLFIFNFIFVLCGLAILILGVLVQLTKTNYGKGIEDAINTLSFPVVTLIVIGSIIFVIAFFGCCGAIRESHCMIVTFASLLLTILIIQVAVAIYAFVNLNKTEEFHLKEAYTENVFNQYKTDNDSRELVDVIQREFECCGVDSYKDFSNILGLRVPGSCCDRKDTESCDQINVRDKPGCGGILEDLFKSACAILGGIALGIAAVELIGIIFALCLANSIKNAERRGYSV
ncbi:CD63 antigen [Linepithema humile]|uniref:CD63 antigen n=1 Tax=Linepithema humile TaxID=83485 RepID=UPI0006238575|nr:PREDICTED: CD63 antigen [Linepithema humile]